MRRLSLNDLVAELRGLRGKTVVTGHSLEDVDALASSVVLAEMLHADVRVIDRENAQAKKISRKLGVAVSPFGEDLQKLNQWNNLVLVDVCNSQMLGVLADALPSFSGKLLAIDHHAHSNPLNCLHYVDESKASCSEIIAEIGDRMGARLSERQASLLALGVLSDSAMLKSATSQTIENLSSLLNGTPLDFREMLPLLDVHESAFERIEAIEAVQRARIERKGGAVFAFSVVKSHEHHAAESLVSLGADVAIAFNKNNGKASMIRSRNTAVSAINCGELAKRVAVEFKGSGGGHELVAGAGFPEARAEKAAEALLAKAKQLVQA